MAADVGTDRTLILTRSEEHTSELQSQSNLVCRLLLEKKNRHHSLSNRMRQLPSVSSLNTTQVPVIFQRTVQSHPAIPSTSVHVYSSITSISPSEHSTS